MKKKSLSIFVLLTLLFPLFLTSCFDSTKKEEKKDIIVDGGDDFLDSIKGKMLEESEIDQLFTILIDKIETFNDVEEIDDVTAQDFSNIAESFAGVIKVDSSHMKANIGYAVARIAMLNKSTAIKEVADSLDRYVKDWDTYDSLKLEGGTGLFARAYRDGGVNGLGTALFANSSKLIRTNGSVPSFPKMVTIAKIQDLVETEILPALSGALTAFENIENNASGSVLINHDTENYEVDLGEIYLADAGIRLLRHSLLLVTAYNFDINSVDGQGIHKVIDDMAAIDDADTSTTAYKQTVSLSQDGDTLLKYYDNTFEADREMLLYMYDVLDHNLNRADFLTLRRANHARMYEDIKAVPVKIKKAIEYIKNETDDQEDDLLKLVDIDDLDAEMVDIADAMIDDGLSIEFASNFKSPVFLADFISEVLAGPYAVNETIDGVNFNYTIDLSKFYTNPVQDLREWFPLYKMTPKLNSVYKELSSPHRVNSYTFTSFTHYPSYDNVDFPMNLIDSIGKNSNERDVYYFKTPTSYEAYYGDVYWDFMPVTLVDLSGVELVSKVDKIDNALTDETLFPHFKDYTFNGIFPDMTRARWIQLAQDLDGTL